MSGPLKIALPIGLGLAATALTGGAAAPAVAAAEGAGAAGAGVGGVASGLAGSGFLGTNLGAAGGILGATAPAAETAAATSGIDGMVANPFSPGNLIDPKYLAKNFWGDTFVGDGGIASKLGNFGSSLMPGETGGMPNGSIMKLGQTGMQMMGGGQQMPQNTAVNSSAPARSASGMPPGSFASSANLPPIPTSGSMSPQTQQQLDQIQQRMWLSSLGQGV